MYHNEYTCADCKYHVCRNSCMTDKVYHKCENKCTLLNKSSQCCNEACSHFVYEEIELFGDL